MTIWFTSSRSLCGNKTMVLRGLGAPGITAEDTAIKEGREPTTRDKTTVMPRVTV